MRSEESPRLIFAGGQSEDTGAVTFSGVNNRVAATRGMF